MMGKNIFRDILDRKIPADVVHEDDQCMAFRDVTPKAPTHILIIPKKEIRTHADLVAEDAELLGHLHLVAAQIARNLGLDSYRLVVNCNEGAGQSVPHLHFHLLGGRAMGWPPG